MPTEGFWSAMGAALMALIGGAGLWAKGRMQNGRTQTVKLDRDDHQLLSQIHTEMKQHNEDSTKIIAKLDQVLQAQAEERGRRGR